MLGTSFSLFFEEIHFRDKVYNKVFEEGCLGNPFLGTHPLKKQSSNGLEVSPGHFELPKTNIIMALKGPSHLRVTCWCILKGTHYPGSHFL